MKRGTLRKGGFCAAWDVFVQLGCTEDGYAMELPKDATWPEYIRAFLTEDKSKDVRSSLAAYLGLDPKGEVMQKLDWLGLFGNGTIGEAGLSRPPPCSACWWTSGSSAPTTRTCW